MTGQAPGQPVEGVVTLSDLAAEMDADQGKDGEQVEEGEEDADPDDVEGAEDDEGEESEESDEADDDEDAEEEATVVLKHDGKDVTLKQSEVVELAQKGFDYTSKTMAVAEERKVVEAEKAKAADSRAQADKALTESVSRLQAYTNFMESQVGTPPPITLAQNDAASYLAQKELYESRKGQLQQAYAEIQRLQDDQARKRQTEIAEQAESTEKVLKDTLPGWNDDTLNDLARFAGSLGLTPDVADKAMLTPGFWQLAHKAKAFDALQAEKAKLKPKNELPRVQKPSGNNHPSRVQAKRAEAEKRYQASPSLNSLADLIE